MPNSVQSAEKVQLKEMETKTKEELKAWLGFNVRDSIGNIGAIVSLFGFLGSNKIIVLISFAVSITLMVMSLLIYFIKPNRKISKQSYVLNIIFNIVGFSILIILMIFKVILML